MRPHGDRVHATLKRVRSRWWTVSSGLRPPLARNHHRAASKFLPRRFTPELPFQSLVLLFVYVEVRGYSKLTLLQSIVHDGLCPGNGGIVAVQRVRHECTLIRQPGGPDFIGGELVPIGRSYVE